MTHYDLFPFTDPTDPATRKRMAEDLADLEEDLRSGGYTKKKYETMDRQAADRIRKWLALPVPE